MKVKVKVKVKVKGVALIVVWSVKVDTSMQDFTAANMAMCQSLKVLLISQDLVDVAGRPHAKRNNRLLPLRGHLFRARWTIVDSLATRGSSVSGTLPSCG